MTKGDLADRPGKDRLTDCPYCCLKLIDARVGRHPACPQVRQGHCPVVPVEESQQVFREILLVRLPKRSHDAEVHRPVLPVFTDKNIARVHIGMKKAVAKRLGEKNLYPVVGKLAQINAGLLDGVDIPDRDTVDALHYEHLTPAVLPIHLGHIDHF